MRLWLTFMLLFSFALEASVVSSDTDTHLVLPENSPLLSSPPQLSEMCSKKLGAIGTTVVPIGTFTKRLLKPWQGPPLKKWAHDGRMGPMTKEQDAIYQARFDDALARDRRKKIQQAWRMKQRQLDYQNAVDILDFARSRWDVDVSGSSESAVRHDPNADVMAFVHGKEDFGFVVGDVSRHGMIAGRGSIFVNLVVNSEEVEEHYDQNSADALLSAVDLASANPDFAFVKNLHYVVLAHAKVDPVKNILSYASAGVSHNFILTKNGELKVLPQTGEFIALSDDPLDTSAISYTNEPHTPAVEMDIHDGDSLFLMSDGITEMNLKGTDLSLQLVLLSHLNGKPTPPEASEFLASLKALAGRPTSELHEFISKNLTPQRRQAQPEEAIPFIKGLRKLRARSNSQLIRYLNQNIVDFESGKDLENKGAFLFGLRKAAHKSDKAVHEYLRNHLSNYYLKNTPRFHHDDSTLLIYRHQTRK